MDGTFRLESRQLSPEQEAEELVRFLKEDPKWKRLDFISFEILDTTDY